MANVRLLPEYGLVVIQTGAKVRLLPDYGLVVVKAASSAFKAQYASGANSVLQHGRAA